MYETKAAIPVARRTLSFSSCLYSSKWSLRAAWVQAHQKHWRRDSQTEKGTTLEFPRCLLTAVMRTRQAKEERHRPWNQESICTKKEEGQFKVLQG